MIHSYAWAAGLFEGEGCFSLHKYVAKKTGVLYVYAFAQLKMTDKDVVYHFTKVIGFGKIRFVDRSREGKRKNAWEWKCRGVRDMTLLIKLIGPFLGSRRKKRAEDVMREAAAMTVVRRKESAHGTMLRYLEGCRCANCTRNSKLKRIKWEAKNKASGIFDQRHALVVQR